MSLNTNPDALSSEQITSPQTVGTSSVQLLAGVSVGGSPGAPGMRSGLAIQAAFANTGNIYVLLGVGTASAANHHIELGPGQSVSWGALAAGGAGNHSDGAWRGGVAVIATAAAQSVCVAVA